MKLTIEGVGKSYRGRVWALRDFSLELGPGVLGLLGPNGAGKSTLMRILATITRPSEGRVTWDGVDVATAPNGLRATLGYLPQDFGVYPNLSAVEFLEYMAAVKGLGGAATRRRIDELLQLVNLTEAARRPLGGYSGGMKQRVGIAQALLNDPGLLIVDEPTVGLDPEERVRFRSLLSDLSGERIVILSTHIVSDVEAVANDIGILNQGRLVQHGTPESLLRRGGGQGVGVARAEQRAARAETALPGEQHAAAQRRGAGARGGGGRARVGGPPGAGQPGRCLFISRRRGSGRGRRAWGGDGGGSGGMSTLRVVYHLARADFLERARRYSFLVTLGLVLYLGYAANTGQIVLRLADYRGVLNSAWVGNMMALVVNLFPGLVWFLSDQELSQPRLHDRRGADHGDHAAVASGVYRGQMAEQFRGAAADGGTRWRWRPS